MSRQAQTYWCDLCPHPSTHLTAAGGPQPLHQKERPLVFSPLPRPAHTNWTCSLRKAACWLPHKIVKFGPNCFCCQESETNKMSIDLGNTGQKSHADHHDTGSH